MEENLVGPNAVAFSMNDEATAAKVLKDFAEKNDKLVIKAGYVDGTVIDAEGVKIWRPFRRRKLSIDGTKRLERTDHRTGHGFPEACCECCLCVERNCREKEQEVA